MEIIICNIYLSMVAHQGICVQDKNTRSIVDLGIFDKKNTSVLERASSSAQHMPKGESSSLIFKDIQITYFFTEFFFSDSLLSPFNTIN